MLKMFTKAAYVAWALFFSLIIYVCIAWVPLIGFLDTLAIQTASLPATIPIIGRTLYEALFDLAPTDTVYALVLSLLSGVNFAMLLYYARKTRVGYRTSAGAGVAGFFVGVLGFGCAACGALFASTLLAGIAGAGLADRLSQSGYIFQVVGIALILYSIWRLDRAIKDPLICEP